MTLCVVTIGDGAMATMCAQIVAGKTTPEKPVEVRVWGRDAARLAQMNQARENLRYLPGLKIAPNVHFTSAADELFKTHDDPVALIIISFAPSQCNSCGLRSSGSRRSFRPVCRQ